MTYRLASVGLAVSLLSAPIAALPSLAQPSVPAAPASPAAAAPAASAPAASTPATEPSVMPTTNPAVEVPASPEAASGPTTDMTTNPTAPGAETNISSRYDKSLEPYVEIDGISRSAINNMRSFALPADKNFSYIVKNAYPLQEVKLLLNLNKGNESSYLAEYAVMADKDGVARFENLKMPPEGWDLTLVSDQYAVTANPGTVYQQIEHRGHWIAISSGQPAILAPLGNNIGSCVLPSRPSLQAHVGNETYSSGEWTASGDRIHYWNFLSGDFVGFMSSQKPYFTGSGFTPGSKVSVGYGTYIAGNDEYFSTGANKWELQGTVEVVADQNGNIKTEELDVVGAKPAAWIHYPLIRVSAIERDPSHGCSQWADFLSIFTKLADEVNPPVSPQPTPTVSENAGEGSPFPGDGVSGGAGGSASGGKPGVDPAPAGQSNGQGAGGTAKPAATPKPTAQSVAGSTTKTTANDGAGNATPWLVFGGLAAAGIAGTVVVARRSAPRQEN